MLNIFLITGLVHPYYLDVSISSFRLARLPEAWRDLGIVFDVRSWVRPNVNICDHPSVHHCLGLFLISYITDVIIKLNMLHSFASFHVDLPTI